MWRQVTYPTLGFLSVVCMAPLSVSADALPFGLRQTFAREAHVCQALYAARAASVGCRAYDVKCPGKTDTNRTENGPLDANGFIASNAYGYTEVHYLAKEEQQEETEKFSHPDPLTASLDELANTLPEGKAIVFLGRFGSDRRLLEMWKVDDTSLKDLTSIPLPANDPKAMFVDRERNAEHLKELLKHGERLASEWSPMVVHERRAFFVERECSGQWVYGGYYVCNRIIKLTFRRIEAGKATTYCQLSAPPRARDKKK